jgi:hypothetical protein
MPSGDPCRAGAAKVVLSRLGEEAVDRELERARRVERVGIARLRDIGVNLEHVLRRGIGEGGRSRSTSRKSKAKTGSGERPGHQKSSEHQHPFFAEVPSPVLATDAPRK